MKKLLSIIFVSFCFAKVVEFSEINVISSDTKDEFTKGGANSKISDQTSATQSLDSVIRALPGAYTQTDQSQGSLQLNLRGNTGLGRANVKIDGVTQTYFGTSGSNGKYHSGHLGKGTSVFGANVDSNFLVGADIQKGAMSGGSSGIFGSANFRTIGVDDVILENQNYGVFSKYSYGSNKIGPSYMISTAAKKAYEGGNFGVLFGYSGKKIRQNYKTGNGENIGDLWVGDEKISPFNPSELTQKPKSILLKFQSNFLDFNTLDLQYRKYQNSLAGRKIKQDSTQANYKAQISDLINLDFLIAKNLTKERFFEGYGVTGGSASLTKDGNLSTKNDAFTFDLSNKSNFVTNFGEISSKFGLNFLNNIYKNKVPKGDGYSNLSVPIATQGKSKIYSFYLDNNYKTSFFEIDVNLNYQMTNLKGFKPECYKADGGDYINKNCFPKAAVNIDKNDDFLNYHTMIYLNKFEIFSPFLSYEKISRSPNVQEMFFAHDYGDSINPFLKPETAKTWQIGFNSYKNFDKGEIGLKILYYKTKVDDFIYNHKFFDFNSANSWILYLNSQKPAKFQGVEASLKFDFNFVFLNASYAYQKSEYKMSETFGEDMGGFGKISELPRDYATIEFGGRYDKFLSGIIAKYTGKSKRTHIDTNERENDDFDNGDPGDRVSQNLPNIPVIYDVYLKVSPLSNLNLKLEIQNLFNKNYVEALNAYNSAVPEMYDNEGNSIFIFPNSSRGRAYIFSVDYKF